jgi:two-component system OmpR family sensor kinase
VISLQKRIRSLTLSLIALLLFSFSILVYFGLSTLLYRHIDFHLLEMAGREASRVEEESGEMNALTKRLNEEEDEKTTDLLKMLKHEEQELLEAIRSSVVLSMEGKVLWVGEAAARVPLSTDHLQRLNKGEILYNTFQIPSRPPLRMISFPIETDGKIHYILQTHMSLRTTVETLRGLLFLLGGVSLLTLGAAGYGSTRLGRAVLTPIETLSATAANISGSTLETRLSLTAPYTEFQHLANAFNKMLDRIQKVFETQRRFVADAAHELRTPLTAMKGNLEVTLLKKRSPEEYRESIFTHLAEVDRLTRLTRSLLTLAKFAGDSPPSERKPLALGPLLRDLLAELSILADDHGIALVGDFQETARIPGDAGQIKQLMINLLDNAFCHTPRGGSVNVRLISKDKHVFIFVEDSGAGIDAKYLPHLFERFYRIESARDRNSGGTGLGLSIAKEIIEAHGGRIEVESKVGRGTTFIVRLPT